MDTNLSLSQKWFLVLFQLSQNDGTKYIFLRFYLHSQRSQDRKWITIVTVNLLEESHRNPSPPYFKAKKIQADLKRES